MGGHPRDPYDGVDTAEDTGGGEEVGENKHRLVEVESHSGPALGRWG